MKKTVQRISKCKVFWGMLALVFVLGAGLFSENLAIVSHAESAAKVTASSAKIRKTADSSSEVIGSAAKDKAISIKSQTKGADGYTWYEVYVDANTLGYIRSDLVNITDGSTPPSSSGTTTTTTTAETIISTTTTSETTTTVPTTSEENPDATTTTEPIEMGIYGDVDRNGTVDVSDAVAVLTYYAKQAAGLEVIFGETPEENEVIFALADVDQDGMITVQDAVYILTYYAQKASGIQPSWKELTGISLPF